MNKKATVFMPVFAILVFILLTYMFYTFNINEEKIKEKIGFGDLQLDLFNTYFEGEKDNLYYEKFIEYSILNTSHFFKEKGGLDPTCNKILKFKTECEPDYVNYYLEIFQENIKDLDIKELQLENNFITITLNKKDYIKKGKDYDFTYTKEFSFTKKIDIDLNELINLKDKIKECLQNNDNSQTCLGYSKKDNNIIIYNISTDYNFYDNSNLVFNLNLEDTGIQTSLLS